MPEISAKGITPMIPPLPGAPPYLSSERWVHLCAQELAELLRLDRLRGGANVEDIKAKMKGSVALFGWERTYESLKIDRRFLEAMLRDNVRRTGNVWNIPGYKASSVDMDPLDAEARKRAAAELREQGEDEAAFLAEYPT